MSEPLTTEWKRYAALYLGLLLALVGGVALVNIVVDPYGRLLLVDVERFNKNKATAIADSRTGKAGVLRQCDHDLVIIGSSRAEGGVNPDYEGLGGIPAYNGGLKGSSIFETRAVANYLLRTGPPEKVLLDLAFFSFSNKRSFADDYIDSPLVESPAFDSLFKYAASLQILRRSYYTVSWNRRGIADPCTLKGFGTGIPYKVEPRFAFGVILDKYMNNPMLFSGYELSEQHFTDLEQILRDLTAAGVEVYPYISPIHATHAEAIAQSGLLDDFDTWKRRVVQIIAAVNADLEAQQRMQLWDFSGYNSITSEPIPPAGVKTQMRWFRESAHHREEAGNLIMDKVLNLPGAEDVPADFGTVLTPENIDEWIRKGRSDRESYNAANPDELEYVRSLRKTG